MMYRTTRAFLAIAIVAAGAARAQEVGDLPLDALLNTQIRTAAKYNQLAANAPASVTIITSEDIDRYRYRTLDQLLASVPGLYVSNDRNYAYLGIRGFSRPTDYNGRILLLLNGHVVNETVFGSAAMGTDFALDLRAIERVEIVRGPGAALYGTGAMFAVVNIILKCPKSAGGVTAHAAAGAERFVAAGLLAARGSSRDALFASLHWRDADGGDLYFPEYDDGTPGAGVARGLDFDRSVGMAGTWSRGALSLTTYAATRTKGVPTAAYGVDFGHPANQTEDRRAFADLRYSHDLSPSKKLSARLFGDYYDYEGRYPYEGIVSSDAATALWMGGEFQLQWDPASNHRVTGGLELLQSKEVSYEVDDGRDLLYRHDEPFDFTSVFVQSEYQLSPQLAITTGLRHDHYSHVGNATSPRVAIVYHPSQRSTLKLLHGTAFRAPNAFELYYVDPFGGLQGNPAVRPEQIRTTELAIEHRLAAAVIGTLSVYDYSMDRLIDPEEGPDGVLRYENVGEVDARGLELGMQTRAQSGLWGYASYALQRTRDRAGEQLTNSPRHLLRAGVSSPLGTSWSGALQAAWESSRRTVYGTDTDPFVVVDGTLSWAAPTLPLRLNLVVRNLFDVDYATPGGFEHLQPAIAQPGAAATLEIEYTFR